MIRATHITLRRGTKILLNEADFVIHPGERVGIVGANGAGKSTLFALINQEIDQDSGTLDIPVSWKKSSISQEISDRQRPALEFVIDGDTELRRLQARRASTNPDTHGQAYAQLEIDLIDAGSLTAQARAEQLLIGLGFKQTELQAPVAEFSGGWQMRLNLARALMAPSDLLLLDEPTNHLDLDAMLWLERWLSSYPGTVIVISHDTEFLDAVAKVILHFDQTKIVRYKGGYQDFVEQRAERMRLAGLAYERQQQDIARLQGFIDRFKAKASKAKQAQSRVKALNRMQQLAPLRASRGIDIHIPSPDYVPDPLLRLDEVSAGYLQHPILTDIKLDVRAGARIGVLGVNGAGKSTLIKTLVGELPVLGGSRLPSKGVEIGYFSQHQLDILDKDGTPLEHFTRLSPNTREQEFRNYLGGFGFVGEMVNAKVHTMSGGEKARLALAMIVWTKPNLLVMDEPSNHLDIDTREALTEALAEYSGSLLLVSHDRHLLRTTVDSFWIVNQGQVTQFDGDLEDYHAWVDQSQLANKSITQATKDLEPASDNDRKAQRRQEAQERQRLALQRKPLEQQLKKIELELTELSEQKNRLDALLADPNTYAEDKRDERLAYLAEHTQVTQRLETIELTWLDLHTQLENIH